MLFGGESDSYEEEQGILRVLKFKLLGSKLQSVRDIYKLELPVCGDKVCACLPVYVYTCSVCVCVCPRMHGGCLSRHTFSTVFNTRASLMTSSTTLVGASAEGTETVDGSGNQQLS